MEIEFIKAAKKAKKITTKQLSDLTNLSENTINNVLSRKTENPSFEVISKMATALEISLDTLIGAKEKQEAGGEDVAGFIATLTDMYEKQNKIYENQIKNERKDKFALFALLAVILVIVFAVLAIDVIDGNVGWIRH